MATATTAFVVAKFQADTASFEQGVARSSRAMDGFKKSAASSGIGQLGKQLGQTGVQAIAAGNGIKGMVGTMAAAAAGFTAMLGPVGLVAIAVVGLVSAITEYGRRSNEELERANEAWRKHNEDVQASLAKDYTANITQLAQPAFVAGASGLDRAQAQLEAYQRAVLLVWRTMEDTDRAFSAGTLSTQDYTNQHFALKATLAEVTKQQQAAGQAVRDASRAIEDAVANTTREMERQLAVLNGSAESETVYKLATMGATEAQLEQVRAMERQLELLKEQQAELDRWKAKAEAVFQATRTPAEKYAEKLRELQELASRGLIDPETLRRATEAAKRELDSATATPASSAARTADFRQVRLADLALQGTFASRAEKGATELGQKALAHALERIQRRLDNPFALAWSN